MGISLLNKQNPGFKQSRILGSEKITDIVSIAIGVMKLRDVPEYS